VALPTKVNVSRPEAWGYEALIEYGTTDAESLYLRLAPGPGRQMLLESGRTRDDVPDLSTNPSELRGESGRSFGRDDFTGGEGLDYAHRRDAQERDPSRFWASSGVDIDPPEGGETREIKLLKATSSVRTEDAGGVNRAPLRHIGTVLYGVSSDATLVDRSTDLGAAWATEDPGSTGNITDLTTLGDEVYAVRGGDIRKRNSAGTWSLETSAQTFIRAWGVKGRIIASTEPSTGGVLYSSDDYTTILHTLPSGETWNDIVDAGAAILAAASDGYIYTFVEENGVLVLKGQTLVAETPVSLAYSQGLLFIGTSEATSAGGNVGRLYRAVFVGIRIREAQVLRKWGDGTTTVDQSPKRIIPTREAIWTAIQASSETQVWKYHLVTGAVSRDLNIAVAGLGQGIVSLDDRILVNVKGHGIYREATTFASTGFVISPAADFFNAAKKAWVGARLPPGSVPAGTQVELFYSTDPAALEDSSHASWTSIITATNASPGDGAETPITGVESRYIIGKVVLTPNGANTSTPTVLSFSFRGLLQTTEEDVPLVVNISDRLELPGRKPLTVNGAGDAVYEKLLDIKGDAVTLTLLRPDKIYKGQIRTISAPIQAMPRKGSPTQVTVRGQLQ